MFRNNFIGEQLLPCPRFRSYANISITKLAATLRKLTCGTLAEFPLPITVDTTEAIAVISARVMYDSVQRKWN